MNKETIGQLEQNESDILVKKGLFFDIKIFGIKLRMKIKPVVLETLMYCNDCAVKLKPTDDKEVENVGDYITKMNNEIVLKSEFIACAVLHSGIKIKMFKKLVALIIRKSLNSEQTSNLIVAILQMYDLANFIPSTRLISQTRLTIPKTTTPNQVDTNAGV